MDLGLAGRTALVTGAASGIGKAAADLFAAEGCRVVLWDLSHAVTDAADDIARRHGARAEGVRVDVTDFPAVRAAFDAAWRGGPVDHVAHCAAAGSGKFGFPVRRSERP